jgi:hypothetical protein
MKTKRIFELKSDRRGLYNNNGKKVEAVKKAKKSAPAKKDKKK